jgi:hypothetical protein
MFVRHRYVGVGPQWPEASERLPGQILGGVYARWCNLILRVRREERVPLIPKMAMRVFALGGSPGGGVFFGDQNPEGTHDRIDEGEEGGDEARVVQGSGGDCGDNRAGHPGG